MKDFYQSGEPPTEETSDRDPPVEGAKDDFILIWLILLGLTIVVSAYLVFLH